MAKITAGYSGTPLAKKLGIKPGMRVLTLGAPADFAETVAPLPADATLLRSSRKPCEVIVAFAKTPAQLAQRLERAVRRLPASGGLWLAWPKKSSQIASTLSFDRVQTAGLELGLVDNKIAAIDETWSGLRLVVRKVNRKAWPVPD